MQNHTDNENGRLSRVERRELAARKKRAAKRRRASMIATLVAVLVIGAVVVVGWQAGASFFANLSPFKAPTSQEEAKDYPGPGKDAVEITVNEGDAGSAIANTLFSNGVIASQKAFSNASLVNPDAGKIQPGTYRLYKELPAAEAIEMLLDLDNLVGNRVQVIPGDNVAKIFQTIKGVTGLSEEELQKALDDPEARGLPKGANKNFEGWLADGDYRFGPDVTAEEVIDKMVARTVSRLTKLEVPKKKWEETLNIAAIIEKEGGGKDDFDKVASVIYNRLDIDMKLQMDSTVHYVFGGSSDASTTDAQRKDNNKWNTYAHKGLPATPIATPGKAAIEAAVDPAQTDYIYFVAVDPVKKITKFSTTWTEHQKNVAEYIAWIEENR